MENHCKIAVSLAIFGGLGLLVTSGRAQAPGAGDSKAVSVSKVERKNRAPVSKEILQVNLPRPVEATLPNGMTVIILEDHRFPTVDVDFTLQGAGALWEPKESPGLASVTAQMLREGTPAKSSKQIGEEIERLGASFASSAPFGRLGPGSKPTAPLLLLTSSSKAPVPVLFSLISA